MKYKNIQTSIQTGLFGLMFTALSASAQTWSNADATYPPVASQNWNLGDNWNTGFVPGTVDLVNISNGGSALINTAVSDITRFLIGNNANASLSHSLLITNGGSLTVTDTSASAFRLFNTAGSHLVTVESGGSLSVAGNLVNGATNATTGSDSFFNSAGTVTTATFTTQKNAISDLSGGTLDTVYSAVGSGGVLKISGGAMTSTSSLRLNDSGTVEVSGGSLNVTGGNGIQFFGTSAAETRMFHVDGSGASSISSAGMRYVAQDDRDNAVWKFSLDNGANHITAVTLTSNGTSGATLRTDATLDVGLKGGILLSGTDTFTLIDRVSGTYSDTWGTGTGALWTDSSGEDIQVSLAGSANKGSLDVSTAGNSVSFAAASVGYLDLTGLSGSETSLQLQLN